MQTSIRPPTVIAPRGIRGGTGPAPWGLPAPWAANTNYVAATLIAPASAVSYNRGIYACQTAHRSGTVFDATQWVLVSDPGNALAAEAAAGVAAQAKIDAQNARDAAAQNKAASDVDAAATAADRLAVHADKLASDGNATSAATNAATITAMLASFRGVFLGAFASDAAAAANAVTNAVTLVAGVMYENTTSTKFRIYSGAAWVDYDASAQQLQSQAGLAATNAAASLASVQALYGAFLKAYLGSYASDALANTAAANLTVPLANGLIYWSTTALKFRVYNAGAWMDEDASAQQALTNATAQATTATTQATNAAGSATAAAGSATTASTAQAAVSAAIASVNSMASAPVAPYLLDGLPPSAIISVPKLAYTLNGAVVTIASLLSFSSAAKYTANADGTYTAKAANTPAIDWASGRARLLIEANAATNLILNSEGALATYALASGFTNAASSFGPFANAVYCSGNAALAYAYKQVAVTSGTKYAVSLFVKMDDGTAPVVSTNTAGAYDMSMVVSGNPVTPDLIQAIGGGIYRISKVFTAASTATFNFGAIKYTTQTAKAFKVTGYQLEVNSYASSYIPTTAAAVTRPADVVTLSAAARALTIAGTSTLLMRGTILSSGTMVLLGSSSQSGIFANQASTSVSVWSPSQLNVLGVTEGGAASPNFGIALANTPGKRIGAANSGAAATDIYPQFNGSETSVVIGANGNATQPSDLYLDELVIWQQFNINSAGLIAQAKAYT